MYLTGKQLIDLCDFMGISVDVKSFGEEIFETELCVRNGDIYDGTDLIYSDGLIAYFAEYPEEGAIGLEDEKYVK